MIESIFSVAKRDLANKKNISDELIEVLIMRKVMGFVNKRRESNESVTYIDDNQILKELDPEDGEQQMRKFKSLK